MYLYKVRNKKGEYLQQNEMSKMKEGKGGDQLGAGQCGSKAVAKRAEESQSQRLKAQVMTANCDSGKDSCQTSCTYFS